MKIYIISLESGEHENRTKEIHWVGLDEEKALDLADNQSADTVYFSIWEHQQRFTEYMRDSWYEDGERKTGKWERNSGATHPALEEAK